MNIPGRALHRIAARFCPAETLERVIEPAIADLQKEHRDAALEPRLRRARVLAAGYVAIWKVLAISGCQTFGVCPAERQQLRRTFAISAGAVVATTPLVLIPPLVGVWQLIELEDLMLLVPQAVPLAVPIGAAVGLAFGMPGPLRRAACLRLVLAAVVCSAAMLAMMNWVMPMTNQSFRQNVFTAMGNEGLVMRGFNEMTLRELARESRAAGLQNANRAREAGWYHHTRWSLSLATLAIAALTLSARRRAGSAAKTLFALTPFVYGLVMFAGERLVMGGIAPPYIGAWLPTVVFGAATVIVLLRRRSLAVCP
jgi:hypothetical protein